MEKEFVPYEFAVKLKELGFNESCFGYYRMDEKFVALTNYHENYNNSSLLVSAPLWQQAFDWFRNNKQETAWIESCFDKYSFHTRRGHHSKDFTTYEQARHTCLEKLIELIQNKNDRSI